MEIMEMWIKLAFKHLNAGPGEAPNTRSSMTISLSASFALPKAVMAYWTLWSSATSSTSLLSRCAPLVSHHSQQRCSRQLRRSTPPAGRNMKKPLRTKGASSRSISGSITSSITSARRWLILMMMISRFQGIHRLRGIRLKTMKLYW